MTPVHPQAPRKPNRRLEHGRGRLILAGLIVVFTAAAFGVAVIPLGPPTTSYGVLSALGLRKGASGTQPYALVRLGDRLVQVMLPHDSPCRVDDRIHVRSQSTLLGPHHRLGEQGCVAMALRAP